MGQEKTRLQTGALQGERGRERERNEGTWFEFELLTFLLFLLEEETASLNFMVPAPLPLN